eukprot:6198566-Pleurochrysis_carterae.AAC.4
MVLARAAWPRFLVLSKFLSPAKQALTRLLLCAAWPCPRGHMRAPQVRAVPPPLWSSASCPLPASQPALPGKQLLDARRVLRRALAQQHLHDAQRLRYASPHLAR